MEETKTSQIEAFSWKYIADKTLKIGVVSGVLFLVGLKDYLLFHSIVEFGTAAIAIAIFLLAWNSRKFSSSNLYIFLGTIFLSSAVIMMFHTLAYRGMGIFPGTDENANLATQLWLANQYVLAFGFVAAVLLSGKKLKPMAVLSVFGIYTALVLVSVFWWKNFPVAYIEGYGLTPFKIYSEYLVAFLFLLSAYLIFRMKNRFDPKIVRLFYLISFFLAFSTILFTLYVGVFGAFNLWGHLVRLAAIYPVYIGIVEFGLMQPYHFLFGNLKKREESLKRNEKMFRAVVEDQTELICQFLPDGTLTFVNDAYCRYYGKSREKLIGSKYFELVPQEVTEADKNHLAMLTPSNPVRQIEHRAIDKDGWSRWQHWTTRAIFDGKNNLVKFQSVGRDITEKKFIEESLKKSEQNYRSLVDNSLVGVYRANLLGDYLYVNEAMAKMFDFYSAEEMIRENAKIRYVRSEDRENFLKALTTNGSVTNYELKGLTKLGKKVDILSSATLVGNEISGMIIEITKRKDAEKRLKESESQYRSLVEMSPAPIFLNIKNRLVYVNGAMLKLFGASSSEELLGKSPYEIFHKDYHPLLDVRIKTLFEGKNVPTVEGKIVRLDGKTLNVEINASPFIYQGSRAIQVLMRDITERKKTEQKILKLAKLPEESPNMVMRVDNRGVILYANPASRKILSHLRFTAGNRIPKKWMALLAESLEKKESIETTEEDRKKIYSIIFTPRPETQSVNIYSIDITEIKRLEKVKDDFISLASHQLRTPLSNIALSSELMLRGVSGELGPAQKEYLGEILKATKKMTLLANNLLNVSRVEMGSFEVRPIPFDISLAVSNLAKELGPLASDKNIETSVNIEENLPKISLDEKSFEIILENLYSNAIRYTPTNGKISLRLSRKESGILLEVSDTGCGIPEKDKKNIFTKSFRSENAKGVSSEGAGLGLYMSKIAADRSAAKIWFESEEGKGAKFFVLFAL